MALTMENVYNFTYIQSFKNLRVMCSALYPSFRLLAMLLAAILDAKDRQRATSAGLVEKTCVFHGPMGGFKWLFVFKIHVNKKRHQGNDFSPQSLGRSSESL